MYPFWPILVVVLSNTLYNICTKSIPEEMNPFASLSVCYLVGAVVSLGLYFMLDSSPNLLREYKAVNWSAVLLGVAIVGLEVGYIYAYRVGWPVSTAQIVQAALLAVVLIVVGALLYKEAISLNKIIGIVICLIGLGFINK